MNDFFLCFRARPSDGQTSAPAWDSERFVRESLAPGSEQRESWQREYPSWHFHDHPYEKSSKSRRPSTVRLTHPLKPDIIGRLRRTSEHFSISSTTQLIGTECETFYYENLYCSLFLRNYRFSECQTAIRITFSTLIYTSFHYVGTFAKFFSTRLSGQLFCDFQSELLLLKILYWLREIVTQNLELGLGSRWRAWIRII